MRELQEELGVEVRRARPLIQLQHDYPDKLVRLAVWRVEEYLGHPHGREGQPVVWVAPHDLPSWSMPAANRPIATAARLPDTYVITPKVADVDELLAGLAAVAQAGATLIQFRAPHLEPAHYQHWAAAALKLTRRLGVDLLLNTAPQVAATLGGGVHLSSARLMSLASRPLPVDAWVAASCHNAEELQQACRIGVDFVVLGPVLATASHPQATPLGWPTYAQWVEPVAVPVYALGGLSPDDLVQAWQHGAQGVAGIRGWWLKGTVPA